MNEIAETGESILPWKQYVTVTVESLLGFYLATFSILMYFTHHGAAWIRLSILLAVLYVFVIVACIKRVAQYFSLGAIMLIIPIAPLIALIIVVTLIPIIEMF